MRGLCASVLVVLSSIGCSAEPTSRPMFVSDGAPAAPSLSLRASAIDEQRMTLDVVGHGIDDLYGVAFRMTYDPHIFRFSHLEAGAAFGDSPSVVVVAREARPGLVVAVVTRQGKQSGASTNDLAVARVTLAISARASGRVELVPSRSVTLSSGGKAMLLTGSGGRWVTE